MHGIGMLEEADQILAWCREDQTKYGRPLRVLHGEAPEGWEFIGSGSFRSVWRSPSGVAYKVTHQTGGYSQSDNEIRYLERAWEKGPIEGCRLPRFAPYMAGAEGEEEELVVAMELITGPILREFDDLGSESRAHLYDVMHEIEKAYRLYDMHDENVIVDEEGLLVPVDFGD